MKLCGCKEQCFVNGDDVWGHWGSVMCLHSAEKKTDAAFYPVCHLTGEDVVSYTTQDEYNYKIQNSGFINYKEG